MRQSVDQFLVRVRALLDVLQVVLIQGQALSLHGPELIARLLDAVGLAQALQRHYFWPASEEPFFCFAMVCSENMQIRYLHHAS